MGGIVFVLSTIVSVLLTANITNIYILIGLITIVGFSLVGLKDDLGKILTKII